MNNVSNVVFYKDKELNKLSTVSILEIVQTEGKREILRNIEHYNLDMLVIEQIQLKQLNFVNGQHQFQNNLNLILKNIRDSMIISQ